MNPHDRREGPVRASPLAALLFCALALGLAHAQAVSERAGPERAGSERSVPERADRPAIAAPYLVITGENGRELARIALAGEPTWHLAWRHSVTGILVRDFYALRDGTMTLTDSHTPAYDAGLGHVPGRGRTRSDGAGGYWIEGIDEPVAGNAYWLRVGSGRVAHTIVHGDERVNLSALAAGERVRVAVEAP